MIKRTHYKLEFKEKIGRELAFGKVSISEVCKREGISLSTLSKWKNQYGEVSTSRDEHVDLNELRMLIKK